MSSYLDNRARPHVVRRVWAAVTKEPQIGIRDLVAQTGYSTATIARALHQLREAGYIDSERGSRNSRWVIVPFYCGPLRVRRK